MDKNEASTPVEIDIEDALRTPFESGVGVVCLQAGMSDQAIARAIKLAAQFGKPFTVVPAPPKLQIDEAALVREAIARREG